MSAELHVVFGAGQVGPLLARRLLDAGKQVRVVRRSSGAAPQGAEAIQGDAADPDFCLRAAQGATTVYHCMNPPYETKVWAELVPRYMDNLIAAASRAGARLVVLDNVYMLGRPAGQLLDEETPPNPCSRKGEIRAAAAERLFAAHRRGNLLATTGRASDFYGPGATRTHLGDQFWRPALAGKTAWVAVNPGAIHTYHYVPDVAAALSVLGCADAGAYGQPWMLPCAPAGSLRDLVARFSRHLEREIRLATLPRWMMKGVGLLIPVLREADEMLYQWDEPFIIDDRRFRARFGTQPEDVDKAAAATVAWAREHYPRKP